MVISYLSGRVRDERYLWRQRIACLLGEPIRFHLRNRGCCPKLIVES